MSCKEWLSELYIKKFLLFFSVISQVFLEPFLQILLISTTRYLQKPKLTVFSLPLPTFFPRSPFLPIFFSHSFQEHIVSCMDLKPWYEMMCFSFVSDCSWKSQGLSDSHLQGSWHWGGEKDCVWELASPSRWLLRHQRANPVLLAALRAIAYIFFYGGLLIQHQILILVSVFPFLNCLPNSRILAVKTRWTLKTLQGFYPTV